MDPNGSLSNDLGSYTSEDYICYVSPLHEALRGTSAMPTLEQFQKLNNSLSNSAPSMNSMPITSEPKGESMFPVDENSMLSYHMDAEHHLRVPFNSIPIGVDSTRTFMDPFMIQGSPISIMNASLKSHEAFDPRDVTVRSPRLSFNSILAAPSDCTKPFVAGFTGPSTIQGSPLAIMNADLKSHEVSVPSPVFVYPEWLISREHKPNTIMSPSYEELYGIASPVNADHICPFTKSTTVQMEIQQSVKDVPAVPFHENSIPCTSSTMLEPRRLREYTCNRCNITFYKQQAFAGHMSSHSKARRKVLHD